MKNPRQALRPSETSLIIQAKIEELAPQEILFRGRLVRAGVPEDTAGCFIKLLSTFRGSETEMRERLRANGAPEPVVDILVEKTMEAFYHAFADEAVRQTIPQ